MKTMEQCEECGVIFDKHHCRKHEHAPVHQHQETNQVNVQIAREVATLGAEIAMVRTAIELKKIESDVRDLEIIRGIWQPEYAVEVHGGIVSGGEIPKVPQRIPHLLKVRIDDAMGNVVGDD